jgi:quercetin dioxygenase-like cupin family protein
MPFTRKAFQVVESQVQLQIGANEIRASAGRAVLVPAGVPHSFATRAPGTRAGSW